jgi:hypothetical protein
MPRDCSFRPCGGLLRLSTSSAAWSAGGTAPVHHKSWLTENWAESHRGAEARFPRAVAASGPPATVVDDHDDRLDASVIVRDLAGVIRRMPAMPARELMMDADIRPDAIELPPTTSIEICLIPSKVTAK